MPPPAEELGEPVQAVLRRVVDQTTIEGAADAEVVEESVSVGVVGVRQ
jgi:hypothetical protein